MGQLSKPCILIGSLLFINTFFNLENIFIKRWKIHLPNVGKYICQTLENTFAKRWEKHLPNVGKNICQALKRLLSNIEKAFIKLLAIPLTNVGQQL